jgi:hypothetical protein
LHLLASTTTYGTEQGHDLERHTSLKIIGSKLIMPTKEPRKNGLHSDTTTFKTQTKAGERHKTPCFFAKNDMIAKKMQPRPATAVYKSN